MPLQLRQMRRWAPTRTFSTGLLTVALALVSGFGVVTRAEAALILITPTDDDRGIDDFRDGNFRCCQADDGLATVTVNSSFEERVGIEFALAALPSAATISAVTLILHLPTGTTRPNTSEVHGYAGDGTITADDLTVSNLLNSFVVSVAGTVDIAIPQAFIQALLTADEDFAGFMLRNVTDPSGVFNIWTASYTREEFYPTLAIEYELVPEPASLLLVGTGLLFGVRRFARGRVHTRPS